MEFLYYIEDTITEKSFSILALIIFLSLVLQGSLSPVCRTCIKKVSIVIGFSSATFSLYVCQL